MNHLLYIPHDPVTLIPYFRRTSQMIGSSVCRVNDPSAPAVLSDEGARLTLMEDAGRHPHLGSGSRTTGGGFNREATEGDLRWKGAAESEAVCLEEVCGFIF